MVVYKTTNIINGKIYIGQDSNNNLNYIGSGTIFLKAVKKYGKINFRKEILCHCENQEELDACETFWINNFNSIDKTLGYNILKNGRSPLGYKHTPEAKLKMSIANKGILKSEEHKIKLRIVKTGKSNGKHSDETKTKIGIGHTGKIVSLETRAKLSLINTGINHPKFGTHHSDEAKLKIGLGRKGKKNSTEAINKMIKKLGKKVEINSICFNSIKEASISLGISGSVLHRRLNDTNNITHKYL